MNVKIQGTAKELRPARSNPNGPLCTGIKVDGQWYDLPGDHRNLYNKVADLIFEGKMARFANPQQPPAQPQSPPPPPPPSATNGHTPRWPNRESVTEAWIYYATQVEKYIKEPYAIVKAANCLVMMEKDGEINPVHREPGEDANN